VAQLGIPLKVFDDAPPDYREAAKGAQAVMKMESVMIGTAVADDATKVEIRAKYKDDAGAHGERGGAAGLGQVRAPPKLAEPKKEMEAALNGPPGQQKPRPLNDLPKVVGGLFGLGALNSLDEWLNRPAAKDRRQRGRLHPEGAVAHHDLRRHGRWPRWRSSCPRWTRCASPRRA